MFLGIRLWPALIMASTVTTTFGQAPPTPPEKAIAAQRDSIAAMDSSIATQRASIEKQRAAAVPGSFFVSAAVPRTILSAAPRVECEPLAGAEIEPLIQDASKREGVRAELVRGVIKQESAFRPCVVSPKGAMGLMQLMPATAETFKVRDAFDPKQSIDAGTRYLKELLNRYKGDTALALAAYNAGPARVDASAGIPSIPETLKYVEQIMLLLPPRP